MAGDHTPLMPVLRWVLERFRDSGREASDVCLLMPCAPLVEAEDLRGAYDAYARSGREIPLLAVVSFPYPVERALALDSEGVLRPQFPDPWHARSTVLSPAHHDSDLSSFRPAPHITPPTLVC